jgi:Asp-tRNA(Asn)/Glu-tRNA(Gln) amidotransferase A subunit family amidase
MARTVADLALLFKVIADPPPSGLSDRASALQEGMAALRGLRVAWYTDDGIAPITDETRNVVVAVAKALGDAGLEVNEAKPPGISRGSALWIELFARAATEQLRLPCSSASAGAKISCDG